MLNTAQKKPFGAAAGATQPQKSFFSILSAYAARAQSPQTPDKPRSERPTAKAPPRPPFSPPDLKRTTDPARPKQKKTSDLCRASPSPLQGFALHPSGLRPPPLEASPPIIRRAKTRTFEILMKFNTLKLWKVRSKRKSLKICKADLIIHVALLDC